MKKRIISMFLSAVMILSLLPFSAPAQTGEITPVIIIGGYASSPIYRFDGNGFEEENIVERVWPLDYAKLAKYVLSRSADGIVTVAQAIKAWDYDVIGNGVAPEITTFAKYMFRNTDETEKDGAVIGTWPTKAAESNLAYITSHGDNENLQLALHEERYAPVIAEQIGGENVFEFSDDWRLSAIECALALGKYIVDVLDYSGAKKVSIISESHGGEVATTYVALCSIVEKGGKKAQSLAALLGLEYKELSEYFNLSYLKNVVADSPALGVQLAYDLWTGTSHFDLPTIVEFVEYATNFLYDYTGGAQYTTEEDFENLLGAVTLTEFNEMFAAISTADGFLYSYLTLGSAWDFLPAAYYESFKEEKLNTEEMRKEYSGLTAKSDYLHNFVMANENDLLTFARDKGVNVCIIAGSDIKTLTGSEACTDGLVAVQDSTGAVVTPYGTRFSNGYETDYTDSAVKCKDPSHDHVAPKMNIDLAYGYLPESTWIISGQFHAMYSIDDYSFALTQYLLFSDKVVDIYSDPAFPQFEATYNAKTGVLCNFDNAVHGTLTQNSEGLEILNLSKKSDIELVSIKVDGAPLTVENVAGTVVPQGEKVTLPLSGEIPAENMQNVKITVLYLDKGAFFSLGERTLYFKTKGEKSGETVRKDSLTPVDEKITYVTADNIKDSLSQFGFRNTIRATLLSVKSIFTNVLKGVTSVFRGIEKP